MSLSSETVAFPRHAVTAVIVAHDGVRWLPDAIRGLLGQTRPVQQVVAVDTGSKDGSAELLVEAFGLDAVIRRNRNVSFGAAVGYAVNACERIDHEAFAHAMGGPVVGARGQAQRAPYQRPGPYQQYGADSSLRTDHDDREGGDGARRQTPGDRYRRRHGLAPESDGAFENIEGDEFGERAGTWDSYAAGHGMAAPENDGFGGSPSGERDWPAGVVEWVWLLHDDCEAAPEALWHLLAVAEMNRSAAVIGPKVRSWYDERQLLEVGITIAVNGARWTGLERREQDQGQHDQVREVLAVSSAGMLVRRDIWDDLQGFDRALAMMRDDVDFCWRVNTAGHRVLVAPEAVVRHAEAASRERRPVDATVDRPHLLDRSHSIYVMLANVPARQMPWALVRLVLSTLVRTAAYLVGKLPGLASDEFFGLLAALSRPDRLMRGRRRRARSRQRDIRELRELFPPRWSGAKYVLERAYNRLAKSDQAADPYGGRHRAVETGPTSEDADDLDTDSLMWLRRLLRRPGFLLVLGLLAITGLASRALLTGGRLAGGALLPAPTGAADLWSAYLNGWHPVSFGSPNSAPPYIAVLAMLATLLLGHASLAVSALMLGCVPLAGLTAYIAAGRLVSSRLLRVWAGLAYALLPATTGAVSGGRLGSVVAIVLLPLLGIGAMATLGERGRLSPVRAAWATGFGLAVTTAFAPFAWVLMALLGVVTIAATAGGARALGRLLIVLAVPLVTLLPWSFTLIQHPASLLLEVGATAGLTARPSAFALVLANPTGPGTFPTVITLGLVLAAVGGLLRTDRRRALIGGWIVALVGFLAALAVNRVGVRGPGMSDAIHVWPGLATALMGAGLIAAALIGAQDIRDRVAASSFGWRQPLALLVVAAAGVAPVLVAGWWVVRGADGPLVRQDPTQVPAFVAAESATPDRPRTLALRSGPGGSVSFALLRDGGATLGAEELKPTRAVASELDAAVASVLSGKGGGETAQLGQYGVRYVLAVAPVDGDLVQTLDGVPGLVRVSQQGGSFMWQNQAPSARLRLVSSGVQGVSSQDVASTGAIGTTTDVQASGAARQLVLAEQYDTHWRATFNGQPLEAQRANGWQQAFAIPNAAGRLRLWYDNGPRTVWVAVEAGLALVALVMALPSGRRRDNEDDIALAMAEAEAEPVTELPGQISGADGTPDRRARRARRAVPSPRRRRGSRPPSVDEAAVQEFEFAPADDGPSAHETETFPDSVFPEPVFHEVPDTGFPADEYQPDDVFHDVRQPHPDDVWTAGQAGSEAAQEYPDPFDEYEQQYHSGYPGQPEDHPHDPHADYRRPDAPGEAPGYDGWRQR